jgi:hypothetical protein
MIKSYLPIAAVVLVVLNSLLLVPATSKYTFLIAIVAFLLAIVVLVLSSVGRTKAPSTAMPATVAPPPPPVPAVNQAEVTSQKGSRLKSSTLRLCFGTHNRLDCSWWRDR